MKPQQRKETVDNKFMTESIRKLSNFNFRWTKTFYQNNLKTITELFATFFKCYRCNFVNCNNQNTKKRFLWEPEKINVKFHKMTTYT